MSLFTQQNPLLENIFNKKQLQKVYIDTVLKFKNITKITLEKSCDTILKCKPTFVMPLYMTRKPLGSSTTSMSSAWNKIIRV